MRTPAAAASTAVLAGALALAAVSVAPAGAASGSNLAGNVTDAHGKALAKATVSLLRSDTPGGTYTPVSSNGTTTTDKKGHFAFTVTDGYYKVTSAKKDCYAPNSYSNATDSVTPTATSGVQQVPPAMTHLALTMDCTNLRPTASFTSPTLMKYGSAVTLDASGARDPNGSIRSYVWSFGDGRQQTTTGATVSHVYAVMDRFTPTLTVIDDQGASSGRFTGSTIGIGDVPGQITNLAATSTPNTANSVTLNWSAPSANSSDITGYTVDISPPRPSITTTQTTAQITGLANNTSYTFTVHATNGFGAGAASSTSGYADRSATMPTILVTHSPVGYTNQNSGNVSFTISPATGASVTATSCSLDGGAPTDCHQPPYSFSGLAPGSHTVVIAATDSNGNRSSTSTQWVIDTTAPAAALLTPTSGTTLTRSIGVRWGGADANGVASFDVRYTKAAWNKKTGGQTTWKSASKLSASSLRGGLGNEYCFSVRSRDGAGNLSGWSARRCTALPLDDRQLSASGGWKKLTGKSFYAGTALRTTTKGASLVRKGAIPGRAALVVERGKGFGTLVVRYNGKTVKTVSLNAGSRQTEVVIALPRVTKSKTTITVVAKTVSAKKPGKPIVVDGLLLARV